MTKIICPYCFERIDIKDMHFQCANPSHLELDTIRTAFEDDVPDVDEEDARMYPAVFSCRSSFFGLKQQYEGICPICNTSTTIKVCPECHSPFPNGMNNLSNIMIAIVGPKNTGKSHYIAVLIKRIRELYRSFGWALTAIDDETMIRYKRDFYNPLFVNKKTLDATRSAAGNQEVKKPLLYSLNFNDGHKRKVVNLAFFDTAGEDMDSVYQMRVLNRYIYSPGKKKRNL